MSKRRIASVATMIGLAVTAASSPAHAYSPDTHLAIVSMAWETMRAAADPAFVNHFAWKLTTANPAKPAPLTDPLTCDFCGGAPQAGEWASFINSIQPALTKLNTLDPELPSACAPSTSDGTLAGVLMGMSSHISPSDDNVVKTCSDLLGVRLQNGAFDGRWHPGGIFDATAPNAAIDGNGFQGLALGWHSKSGDDDLRDVVLNSGLVTELIVLGLIIAALIALGIISGVGLLAGLAVLVLIALCACIFGWLSGDGCGATLAKVGAAIVEDTGLESLLHEAAGVVPSSVGDFTSGDYTGMWHFINSEGGGTNSYDDRRGLYWDEAGPGREPGQMDVIVQAALDLGSLHLDYDESHGRKQYEILSSDDKHPNSVARDKSTWQGVTAAHLQFSPIDNFAFWGWSHFKGTRQAHWLRWPLHALGDATVPMHVVGTSSHGHRPYEDTLIFVENWSETRFLPTRTTPELVNTPPRTCFPATGPDPTCLELPGSRDQLEQARRILWHALRWRRFIQTWRTTNNNQTDVPVRDLVTALAVDVRSTIQNDSNPSWPWCDDCSVDYKFHEDRNHKGMSYYQDPERMKRSRDLVERSIGATLAFLITAADSIPAPTCGTKTCNATTPCCSGTCQANKCCQPLAAPCDKNSDCCSSSGNAAVCRNRVCVSAAAGVCQGASHSCEDGSAVCCQDSAGGKQCGTSPNGVNICCSAKTTSCTSSAECCTGSCKITVGTVGVCSGRPTGASCTSATDCDTNEDCALDGASVSGTPGFCCNPSATASLDCTTNSDCCTGICAELADDVFKCTCAPAGTQCARNNDCCGGNSCVNGTCTATCKGDSVSCGSDSECCLGTCCATIGNKCTTACPICKPANSACDPSVSTPGCCAGTSCCVLTSTCQQICPVVK